MDKIKNVGNDWNYLHDNYQYARVTFITDYMNVKSVSLKDVKFSVKYDGDVTIDKIKDFFKGCINEDWKMDLKDFQKNYEGLVELVLYDDCLIVVKFEKEKYYKLFNIEKGNSEFEKLEKLFAPYSLELTLEYTTLNGKTEEEAIEFIFKNYIDDFLVVRKVISDLLTIRTEPFQSPYYVIILKEEDNKNK